MEDASRADGFASMPTTTARRSSSTPWELHDEELGRRDLASKPAGHQAQLHGEPALGRNAGSKSQQGTCVKDEARSHGRGAEAGGPGNRRGQTGRGCKSSTWSSRWSSFTSSRPSSSGRLAQGAHPGEGDGRADQAGVQTNGGRSDDQDQQQGYMQHTHNGGGKGNQPCAAHQARQRVRGRFSRIIGVLRGDFVNGSEPRRPGKDDVAARSKVLWHDQSSHGSSDVYDKPASRSSTSLARYGGGRRQWESGDGGGTAIGSCGSYGKVSSNPPGLQSGKPHASRARDQQEVSARDRHEPHIPPSPDPHVLQAPNPWTLHQQVKHGQAQLIAAAWAKHEKDRKLISQGHREIMEVMHQEWNGRFQDFMNETFVSAVDFPKTFVTEVYTTTKPILREAARRGHRVGSALSLETGWNFLRALDRRAARKLIDQEKPYFLAIAFPCGPWSPLMRLNPAADLAQKQAEGLVLIRFAIQLAKDQLLAGRHYLLENPLTSKAWTLPEMVKFLEEKEAELADFHQCRFGLKNDKGEPHRKATRVATSSPQVREQLHARRCLRDHQHAPVLGGAKVTVPAGHYPAPLARAMVKGMEEQFEVDFKAYPHEALAVDGEVEEEEQPEVPALTNYGSDSEEEEIKVENPKVPAGIVQAVRRLHENTGHRSNRRLARALIISGAPAEAVLAAKHLKCAICDEQKRPKVQRPASLPVPKDISDQVHLDIFEAEDALGRHHYVIHAVDFASRFQMAEVIAHKSSEAVVKWFTSRWQPIFGPPRVIVADQGREFVSYTFEEMCARSSTLLWHAAVQAPWQNGVCERAGGVLKGLLHALVKAHSIVNAEDLNVALQEAVTAYNNDINEMGVSPCQAALGRQPRMIGDTLGDFGQRLAEHGLIDDGLRPSLMRQMALRETAKVAMTRLHFSRGLRRAELARSRSTTTTHAQALEPGMIVYFYRQTKYNNKTSPSKKKLSLRRWHGPALLVAKEGHTSAFVSFKGQLTKCAVEHLRPATTLEQISAETWRDAIEDVVEAAIQDMTRRGAEQHGEQFADGRPQALQPEATTKPMEREPQEGVGEVPTASSATGAGDLRHPGGLPGPSDGPAGDLPPVRPQEFANAVRRGSSRQSTPMTSRLSTPLVASRRTSTATEPHHGAAAPGTPVPELILNASQLGERMGGILERAREMELDDPQQRKRAADVETGLLRDLSRLPEPSSGTTGSGEPSIDVGEVPVREVDELVNLPHPDHPLRQLHDLSIRDRLDPESGEVRDHGTWRGDWPMPSRTYIQAMKQAGAMWPCGDHDVCAVQTARKEYMWRSIASQDRPAFQEAAKTGWMVWADNDAVEVLSPDEAAETFKRLRANNEMHKVLTPRYVFTDKHDGLRTPSQPLPLKANARLVVPGFRDPTAYAVRKDAPTASRTACHLVLIITASMQWDLWSADIKSAFLKGELFKPNERELYIGQIKTMSEDEPKLPLGGGGLAKLKKGIFGLSDSPRRWYLRLNKSLTKLGWRRSALDAATWYLWTEDSKTLLGIVIAHVDDLLMGGGKRAKALLDQLGEELGFGSLEHNRFTYCGKFIEKKSDGNIYISMREYHENLKPVAIPLARRRVPDAALTPAEIKQLRALVGSMQWLVANCRFDMGFMLSALQGEKRVVATLMKANQLAKRFKEHVDFALCFKPINLDGCGLMVVSDASLGNVNQDGGSDGEPLTKLFSQAAYFVLLASKELMNGKKGRFAILDARSHRLPRVCRSTFAAELLGVEEAMDVGHYHRGFVAELNGLRMDSRAVDVSLETVPLTVVTDAKDVYDKNTSDTPSYGSQKSLAFTVAWLRNMLRRPQTTLRWTSTENMFVDAGTKDMELDNLHTVLRSCEWCVTYRPDFVRQTVKKQPKQVQKPAAGSLCVGKPVDLSDEIFSRLLVLSEQPGWHHQDGVGIHVARYAKSYRLPKPRFNPVEYCIRSSFGRFDCNQRSEWRELERNVDISSLANA
ncbi:unnamed protein product [Effrenium voratum]|uniref:Integrase catalytic domain-containing protein n=1 Tax=Effrenium voratum TaxID=2562239 RepID=A0AA36JER9_9DINO|nr:unnamed protein product [Effrenium voratum]